MRFTWDGMRFKIWFRYEGDGQRRETICFIDEEDAPGTTFAMGSAVCAKSDVFCKNTGRRVALTKTLPHRGQKGWGDGHKKIFNVCGGDWDRIKQFRTAAWQCYLKRAEQPTKEKVHGAA